MHEIIHTKQMNQSKPCHIGAIHEQLGLSCDTLRYYEKIGLIRKVKRSKGGVRCYTDNDISRLQFIIQAKCMNFSLDEIKILLSLRENPILSSRKARNLAHHKIKSIEKRIMQLETLQDELSTLLG